MNITKFSLKLVRDEEFEYKTKTFIPISEPGVACRIFNNVFDVASFCEEHTMLLCLDVKGNVIGVFEVSIGNVDTVVFDSAIFLKRALLCNAFSIIVAHNHPSGDLTPSKADIKQAQTLKQACEVMNVKLLDCLILGNNNTYTSMQELRII